VAEQPTQRQDEEERQEQDVTTAGGKQDQRDQQTKDKEAHVFSRGKGAKATGRAGADGLLPRLGQKAPDPHLNVAVYKALTIS
jgi:hypothetical protein